MPGICGQQPVDEPNCGLVFKIRVPSVFGENCCAKGRNAFLVRINIGKSGSAEPVTYGIDHIFPSPEGHNRIRAAENVFILLKSLKSLG